MAERLIGIETEYAISGRPKDEAYPSNEWLVRDLLDLARRRFDYLPDYGDGLFLGNGSRLYVDYGMHPELATPECTNPSEVVRYVLAGERILAKLVGELEAKSYQPDSVSLWKCNVDYSGTWATWGCHESYLHRMNPGELSPQIIPHLVSRLIYTGAGGFDSDSPGIKFTLSPRVPHITNVTSPHSTSDRGIFHTKDETLASEGFHRLHLICGESLCSEISMWLKVATTALIVAMAEAGLRLSNGVELVDPLVAMRDFASDPQCKATAEVVNRKRMTAIEIQRHYLSRAEAHMHDSFMPSWAEEACRKWREILDRLERGSGAVNRTLDWAIKLALYEDFAKRQGVRWKTLSHWTQVRERTQREIAAADPHNEDVDSFFENKEERLRRMIRLLQPFMDKKNLNQSDFGKYLRLRKQLFEIDTHFGQLGGRGIFAELDREGILDHKIPDLGDIEQAMIRSPNGSRARLRGDFIRRVGSQNNRYYCDWQGIWDSIELRALDLNHPFATEERWFECARMDGLSAPDSACESMGIDL